MQTIEEKFESKGEKKGSSRQGVAREGPVWEGAGWQAWWPVTLMFGCSLLSYMDRQILAVLVALLGSMCFISKAHAVPSFARQTGMA